MNVRFLQVAKLDWDARDEAWWQAKRVAIQSRRWTGIEGVGGKAIDGGEGFG